VQASKDRAAKLGISVEHTAERRSTASVILCIITLLFSGRIPASASINRAGKSVSVCVSIVAHKLRSGYYLTILTGTI